MKSLKGVSELDRKKLHQLEDHLTSLYEKENFLQTAAYHIVILWADEAEIMSDVWIYQELESEETGYTVDCKTYRQLKLLVREEITASDGLIMLGKETELSERMRFEGKPVEDYMKAKRPKLPERLNPSVFWYM